MNNNDSNKKSTLTPALAAPTLPLKNENNTINYISSIGTPIQVAPYLNMQVDDIVTMYVRGFDELEEGQYVEGSGFLQAHQILKHNIVEGCGFFVPGKQLKTINYGHIQAYYEVRTAGSTLRSMSAHVFVDMRVGGE